MKYILERNSFTNDDIKKALNSSIKSGDISMKISPDEFINKELNRQYPEIGTFESMVKSSFISHGDESRMGDFIKRFKELNIDVSKLEELFPKYLEYKKYPLDPPMEYDYDLYDDNGDEVDEEIKRYDDDMDKWYDESDIHEEVREEFNNEVKRLCVIARKILDI